MNDTGCVPFNFIYSYSTLFHSTPLHPILFHFYFSAVQSLRGKCSLPSTPEVTMARSLSQPPLQLEQEWDIGSANQIPQSDENAV